MANTILSPFQLEESEEEVAEVMKKYKASVSQLSVDQINISEQAQLIADLEHEKQVEQSSFPVSSRVRFAQRWLREKIAHTLLQSLSQKE